MHPKLVSQRLAPRINMDSGSGSDAVVQHEKCD
jgi:hypothetical protein